MKKIISLMLIVILLVSLSSVAFAAKSPTIEYRFVPKILTSYFRVCDIDGKLVRYLSLSEVTIDTVDIQKYEQIENLLYAFSFTSSYELKEGEYVEFPVQFNIENTLKAVVDETELTVEKIVDDLWMLHISKYGDIIVTVIEK